MTRRFEERLAQVWPVSRWGRVPVVVAVSGGADSVALSRALVSLADTPKSTLIAAHFDHRLRADSPDDADFVSNLCREVQIRCEVGIANRDLVSEQSGGIEEAAREARYEFLTKVARRVGARYVATAHTADDQAETILHRIVRGTGIRGLAGIPASRELVSGITLVRPLLGIRRTELIEYLDEIGQPFREDPTNSEDRFTRNRIRNTLLPTLRDEYNPQVDDSLRRLGILAEEMSSYVESSVDEQLTRCVHLSANTVSIDLNHLTQAPPLIVRALLRRVWRTQDWPEREMTFERWHELEQLAGPSTVESPRTVITLPADLRVERKGMQLTIQTQGQP